MFVVFGFRKWNILVPRVTCDAKLLVSSWRALTVPIGSYLSHIAGFLITHRGYLVDGSFDQQFLDESTSVIVIGLSSI
jgi:hypothetical protein